MPTQYWEERIDQIAKEGFDSSEVLLQKLMRDYRNAADNVERLLVNLYLQMLQDTGNITPLMLYKEQRYLHLRNGIKDELEKLAVIEKDAMTKGLSAQYEKTFKSTAEVFGFSFDFIPASQVEKTVKANWLGRNFSSSVWNNKVKLIEQLEKSVTNSIATGAPKEQAVQKLMDSMNVGFSNADRLVRTEMNFTVNQAQKDGFMAAGFNQYKILAALDARTSDICREENGKIYDFVNATAGVNYPPFHANCRTTVIPIIED